MYLETNRNSKESSLDKENRKKKVIENVELLVSRDKFEEAMKILLAQSDLNTDLKDRIFNLQSRLKRYTKDIALNVPVDPKELNRIGVAIISIKNEYYLDKEEDDSKNGIISINQSIPRNLTLIMSFLIFALVIFSFNQNHKIKKHESEIKYLRDINTLYLTQNYQDTLSVVLKFDSPKSIWGKSVIVTAEEHYSKVRFNFKGIYCVSANPIQKDTSINSIVADIGEQFYVKKTSGLSPIWGINVMERNSESVTIEYFFSQN